MLGHGGEPPRGRPSALLWESTKQVRVATISPVCRCCSDIAEAGRGTQPLGSTALCCQPATTSLTPCLSTRFPLHHLLHLPAGKGKARVHQSPRSAPLQPPLLWLWAAPAHVCVAAPAEGAPAAPAFTLACPRSEHAGLDKPFSAPAWK